MKSYETIDAYLADTPLGKRAALEHIRQLVQQYVPDAEESISYGMPTFKYNKKALIYFAAFKDHLSIFPTSTPVEALEEKLRGYATAKGTIHFTLDNPLPDALIKEILDARLAEIRT
jgi:uncharacterized protein YdhG (YjbR/CyaY superfamily)